VPGSAGLIVALRKKKCCNAILELSGTPKMTTAKFLRRQAASCATLAKQTNDEESRQRCLWLEQTFLQLAETKEQVVPQVCGDTEQRDDKRSA
jgi:hypothetical protein